ncbi:MAG TPA: 23S rRNA (guanosine(2251)-2'-O)-methyltransferase RlmB [Aliidongia sp.]|nr:23S rRNA (guanosine(2251)-2'-O)-methyltransferase RlmB [Aliidongia sp.]
MPKHKPAGRPPHSDSRPSPAPRPAARATPKPPGESGNWLWGRHAVLAALANPERKLLRLVATEEAAAELAQTEHASRVQLLGKDELNRLLPPGAVHQGLALQAKPLAVPAVEDLIEGLGDRPDVVLVALDQVTDPHNIGAIMRSAAAFGARALLLPERNTPEISGTLAKSASGAVEHLPLIRVINLNRTLDLLKESGFWIVGLDGEAEKRLSEHKLDGRICLVLGAEGDGLRRLTREACDLMARLPTAGPIASLNVSNAAAIALYEIARNR